MATESINSIGSGKTYSSLAAWEAGEEADLVTADEIAVGEVYGSITSGSVLFSGWTTDATRYIEVRAASGEEADFSDLSGAKITFSADNGFHTDSEYVKVRSLNIELQSGVIKVGDSDVNYRLSFINSTIKCNTYLANTATAAFEFYCCFLWQYGTSTTPIIRNATNVRNCVLVQDSSYGICMRDGNSYNSVAFCTQGSQSYSSWYSPDAGDYNAANDTSSIGANSVDNITTSEFADAANDDWHLSGTGSSLYEAGDDMSAYYTVDADGDTWGSTYSIGFDEPAAAGGVTVTPNKSSHAHSADQPILTQAYSLSPGNAAHAHVVDQPALTQAHSLTPVHADHAHSAGQPSLVQAHILVTDHATHSHTADEPLLTGAGTIVPDDAAHAHAADQPTLVQAHILAVLSATHAHTAGGATLTVGGVLAVDDALHGHLADSAALTQAHQLSTADATHAHTAEQPGLTQAHVITPAEALHGHTADQPTLDLSLLIVANDAIHAHSADQPTLTQAHVLGVQDALHAQLADQSPLYTHVTLVADDALHAHLAANAALIVGELQTPSGRVFLVRSDLIIHLVHGERRVHMIH